MADDISLQIRGLQTFSLAFFQLSPFFRYAATATTDSPLAIVHYYADRYFHD